MNDLLYYEPLADLFEGDATYRDSPTQIKFGYLTLAASFHWNLLKLLGDISPTYHLAPPAAEDRFTLAQLPYLDGTLRLHVKRDGVPSGDWLEHATAAQLAEVHSDCMASLLHAGSADVASLLSNVGHTVVIRVILIGERSISPYWRRPYRQLIRGRQANLSPVEALYSRLFVGRKLCDLSLQLACNAAALDGAVVIDQRGIVRGIGCIFETGRRRTATEGARTRAALFGSKDGLALKVSQDGEMSIFSNGKNEASMFAAVWYRLDTSATNADYSSMWHP